MIPPIELFVLLLTLMVYWQMMSLNASTKNMVLSNSHNTRLIELG